MTDPHADPVEGHGGEQVTRVAAAHGVETVFTLSAPDQVVTALGGGGEMVTRPGDVGPALDRAFASGVPYLVNVVTDPDVADPRTTTGI